jgi:hypothetical protein
MYEILHNNYEWDMNMENLNDLYIITNHETKQGNQHREGESSADKK